MIAEAEVKTADWYGLYGAGWGDTISTESNGHPAKMSRKLATRIYQHLIERGYLQRGDCVLDPFAGIGGTAFHAMHYGCNWVGVELEARFVELARGNLSEWQRRYGDYEHFGKGVVLQGDSRRLVRTLACNWHRVKPLLNDGLSACVSSPPFLATEGGCKPRMGGTIDEALMKRHNATANERYGVTPGQLGAMKDDGFDAVVSSPPFNAQMNQGGNTMASNGIGPKSRKGAGPIVTTGYGTTPGQLGAMKDQGFDAVVSSPPFLDARSETTKSTLTEQQTGLVVSRFETVASGTRYGQTPGQLGAMKDSGFGAVVSSPPFQKQLPSHDNFVPPHDTRARMAVDYDTAYGASDGQLGNSNSETFWTASKQIVEGVREALCPEAVAVFVCGDFRRDGKRVRFSEQWAQLCESCGFELVEWIKAWKVQRTGTQFTIDGKEEVQEVSHVSFFRRLSNKNGEAIENEDVLILRRL